MTIKGIARRRLLAGCALITLGSAAEAQTAPPQAEDGGTPDIIVTAQARSERLQNVPIQVRAFTDKAIADADIRTTADVAGQIPNMSFDHANNYRSTFITMRGITQISNADPPVAYVIDGVPQTNQETLSTNLFDIERIEVLKGPQGALYGRNAVGGAINIVTKAPTNDFEGFGDVSFGNGNTVETTAGVSGPIAKDVALFRVTGTYKYSNGLIHNDFRDDNVDYIDHDYTLRGRLLLTPSDALKIDLHGEYGNFRGGTNGYSAVFSGDPNDFVNPQFNFPAFSEGHTVNLSAKIDYDLHFATLTSISAYSDYKQHYEADLDFRNPVASPGGFFGLGQLGQGQDIRVKTISQELRLVSSNSGPFRWLFGGYYLHTKHALLTRGFLDPNSDPAEYYDPALIIINKNAVDHNNAYAVFGQLDYDLTSTLTLTGGLRYDRDQRHQTDLSTGDLRAKTYDHLQPKVTLTWKPEDGRLLYATYSTGFRSGGFNAPGVSVPEFKPETLRNYEVGFKTQWLDRKLTINGSAFWMDLKNYQFFYVDSLTASQIIDTINKVRIKGIELETIATPYKGFDFGLAVGLIDPKIRRSLFPEDVGNKTPRTTPFTLNGSVQYRWRIGGDFEAITRAEYTHNGKKYWSADNAAVQDPYEMVNLRAGIERGGFGIYGFTRNLLNAKYSTDTVTPKYSGSDVLILYRGQPRTYGIEAKYKF
jgi:iron complex outermembrane recepter protein